MHGCISLWGFIDWLSPLRLCLKCYHLRSSLAPQIRIALTSVSHSKPPKVQEGAVLHEADAHSRDCKTAGRSRPTLKGSPPAPGAWLWLCGTCAMRSRSSASRYSDDEIQVLSTASRNLDSETQVLSAESRNFGMGSNTYQITFAMVTSLRYWAHLLE